MGFECLSSHVANAARHSLMSSTIPNPSFPLRSNANPHKAPLHNTNLCQIAAPSSALRRGTQTYDTPSKRVETRDIWTCLRHLVFQRPSTMTQPLMQTPRSACKSAGTLIKPLMCCPQTLTASDHVDGRTGEPCIAFSFSACRARMSFSCSSEHCKSLGKVLQVTLTRASTLEKKCQKTRHQTVSSSVRLRTNYLTLENTFRGNNAKNKGRLQDAASRDFSSFF